MATAANGLAAARRRGNDDRGLFATYSLILATFLGTMGLPHVLVRFYTNPDGAAARRTTLVVLGLVGVFYLLPTLYGVLGRIYTPQLLVSGQTDAVVVLLPGAALGDGLVGRLLAALVAAGAFAAFLSTSSGLLTSVAGVSRRTCSVGRLGTRLPAGHCLAGVCRPCWRCTSPDWTCRRWSGWPSRSPRRASAPCWCSASGGAG